MCHRKCLQQSNLEEDRKDTYIKIKALLSISMIVVTPRKQQKFWKLIFNIASIPTEEVQLNFVQLYLFSRNISSKRLFLNQRNLAEDSYWIRLGGRNSLDETLCFNYKTDWSSRIKHKQIPANQLPYKYPHTIKLKNPNQISRKRSRYNQVFEALIYKSQP